MVLRFRPVVTSRLALGLLLSGGIGNSLAESLELPAVNVQGQDESGYRVDTASVGGFNEAPLLDTPASITVLNATLIKDQQARLLSEVLRNDASVGDSYAPIGYYENFVVRGFSLNAASSYKINGRTITGEQNVALENKQQVEVLKGLAGLQSGISEPSGVINYVTKRPEDVRSVTVSSDDRGSGYIATDVGGWFGSEQQLGLRANVAHEDLNSYVEHANGQRDFVSLAFDWNISPDAVLKLDAEYQNKQQRSVPGYQLLGGTEVPHDASPKKLLGHQSGSKQVGIDSLNLNGSFEYRFSDQWKGSVSAARSKVVIDDYSAFAWGGDTSGVGNTFTPQGNYDIYDYRSPDDTRRNDQAQATVSGAFATGALRHQLMLGVDYLQRTIDRHGSINEMIGSGNIDADPPVFAQADAALDPKRRRLDSTQSALLVSDRIGIGEAWQLLLGARQVRYDERAWDRDGALTRRTRRSDLLPQAALLFKPQDTLSLYASFAKGLSPGGTASWFASNADQILAPTSAYQSEAGVKYEYRGLSWGAALFDIRQAYQYAQPQADGSFLYLQQGRLHNRGIELSADGAIGERLHLQASVACIRARAEDTGTPAYEGHQALNVPRLRASAQASWDVPGVAGLALLGGAQYSGAKYADRGGRVEVGGYTVYNLGARYATRLGTVPTTLRLSVDNVADKRYWRDVGDYQGDDYLFLGAPRTARLALQFDF